MRILERPPVIAMLKGLAVLASMLHGQVWPLITLDYENGAILGVYVCRIILAAAVTVGFLYLPGRHSLKVSLLAVVAIAALIGIRWVLGSPPCRSDIWVDWIYALIIIGVGALLRSSGQQRVGVLERPVMTAVLTGLTVLVAMPYGFGALLVMQFSIYEWDLWRGDALWVVYFSRFMLTIVVTLSLVFLPARHAMKISLLSVGVIAALIGIERMLILPQAAGRVALDIVYGAMLLANFLLREPGQPR